MKLYLLTIFLYGLFLSCSDKKDLDYAVIIKEPSPNSVRFPNSTASSLSIEEIDNLEQLIKRCISDYNSDLRKRVEREGKNIGNLHLYLIEDLSYYKRQYVPTKNEDGEKIVWVNSFCSADGWDWQNEVLGVDDGGNCYFDLIINLSTGDCYDIQVNGYS